MEGYTLVNEYMFLHSIRSLVSCHSIYKARLFNAEQQKPISTVSCGDQYGEGNY